MNLHATRLAASIGLLLSVGSLALPNSSFARTVVPTPACSGGSEMPPPGTPLSVSQTTPWDNFVPNELAPDQWLAKLYTEVLGCAPDQSSYVAFDKWIKAQGCTVGTLRTAALAFLSSPEFLRRRDYGYAERLLILWRVGGESEPTPRRFDRLLQELRSGARWADVARRFLTLELASSLSRLCSGQLYGWNPDTPVIDIPTQRGRGASVTAPAPSFRRSSTRPSPGRRCGWRRAPW